MELPEWNVVVAEAVGISIRIGLAIVVLIVGRILAGTARRVVLRALARTDLTPSMTTIFVAVAYYGIWLLTIVVALLVLGAPSSVVLSCVGLVLIILVFSLQQSLRDLAAAVIFMLFKPFRLGDLIETIGTTGTVEDIGPFTTTLVRWDGKVVVLPNSQIQELGITNYTTKPGLVTDLMVRIPFGADVERARELIRGLLEGDPRMLPEPPLRIPVVEENDSWVVLNVRAGVRLDDYWDLQDSLRESIRKRLEQEAISVPYPRTDVRLGRSLDRGEDPDRAA